MVLDPLKKTCQTRNLPQPASCFTNLQVASILRDASLFIVSIYIPASSKVIFLSPKWRSLHLKSPSLGHLEEPDFKSKRKLLTVYTFCKWKSIEQIQWSP